MPIVLSYDGCLVYRAVCDWP